MSTSLKPSRMFQSYEQIKEWRETVFAEYTFDHNSLNQFHDDVIKSAAELALKRMESERGDIPARFSFLVMGSAGRQEQSFLSDQDHGFIFSGSDEHQPYFLELGKEIVKGLAICGYEKCEGKVMADNPLWTKTEANWNDQLGKWLKEKDWESLRHFSIFSDARVLSGDSSLLAKMKKDCYRQLLTDHDLLHRLCDNVQFIKRGAGMFGQLLPEQKGRKEGMLNYKETVLFPYVNGARLLSFKHTDTASSTLLRLKGGEREEDPFQEYRTQFKEALEFRLKKTEKDGDYNFTHYIPVNQLSAAEKKQIKKWMKYGNQFMKKVTRMIRDNEMDVM